MSTSIPSIVPEADASIFTVHYDSESAEVDENVPANTRPLPSLPELYVAKAMAFAEEVGPFYPVCTVPKQSSAINVPKWYRNTLTKKERAWFKEQNIPVNSQTRKLFFLVSHYIHAEEDTWGKDHPEFYCSCYQCLDSYSIDYMCTGKILSTLMTYHDEGLFKWDIEMRGWTRIEQFVHFMRIISPALPASFRAP